MDRKKAFEKITAFLISKGYQIRTQTENLVTFQTDGREINWVIFLVLCCLGLFPAIIYYYVFAPRHQVTVSFVGEKEVRVTISSNTDKAKQDMNEAMAHLNEKE